MNEIRSVKDVKNLRKNPIRINAWDFVHSDGDTIKEKYAGLYSIITCDCLKKNDSEQIAKVFANKFISSFLHVCQNSNEIIFKNEKINDITYVGEFLRSCGSNGYNSNFHLYESQKLSPKEIIVLNGEEVSLIKLFNCPY